MNSLYSSQKTNGLKMPLGDGREADVSAIWSIELGSAGPDAIRLRLVDAQADAKVAILETNPIEAGGAPISIAKAESELHADVTWRPFAPSDLAVGMQADALRLCADRITILPGLINILGKAVARWTETAGFKGAMICAHGDMKLALHHPKLQRSALAQVTVPNAATNTQLPSSGVGILPKLLQGLGGAAPSPRTQSAPQGASQAPSAAAPRQTSPSVAPGNTAPRPKARRPNSALKQWF